MRELIERVIFESGTYYANATDEDFRRACTKSILASSLLINTDKGDSSHEENRQQSTEGRQ